MHHSVLSTPTLPGGQLAQLRLPVSGEGRVEEDGPFPSDALGISPNAYGKDHRDIEKIPEHQFRGVFHLLFLVLHFLKGWEIGANGWVYLLWAAKWQPSKSKVGIELPFTVKKILNS